MGKINNDSVIREQIFTFYKNVKYLREKNNLTIKQMAEIIDISEKRLMQAECCVHARCLSVKHLRNICLYFKMSADTLMEDKLY